MSSVLLTVQTNLTGELTALMDTRLDELTEKYGDPTYADLLGYHDSMEHLTGLGFVACQAYVCAVYGLRNVPKNDALSVGPLHACGRSVASIVNVAANYWKHNFEWHLDHSPRKRRYIEAVFEDVGFPVGTDYPLSGVLAEISSPDPASFGALNRKLALWKAALEKRLPDNSRDRTQ